MADISIELVPRSYQHLEQECLGLQSAFPFLDTVNIPDLLRMPIHSWEACRYSARYFQRTIPHLRASDFDLHCPEKLQSAIDGFDEVLVISGDPPQGFSRQVYSTGCLEMIDHLKTRHPDKRVIAGIDPYRHSLQRELEYIQEKAAAGADAFFTQPFFSLPMLQSYQELLVDREIYWGVSPVIGAKSKNYWEHTNHAVFPPDFEFTLAGNQRFARSVLSHIREHGGHIYFMPIRIDTVTYLQGIL